MFNVLKRLAKIDAMYPNIQYDTTAVNNQISECGMMGSAGQSTTPASINITAGSGEELTGMLRDIVKLAGVGGDTSVQPEIGQSVDVLSPTPTLGVTTTDGEAMRSVIDKLHDTGDAFDMDDQRVTVDNDDSEEKVDEYDNTPGSPQPKSNYDADQRAYHPNSPGAASGRANMNNPRGVPTHEQIESDLFSEYQRYLSEN